LNIHRFIFLRFCRSERPAFLDGKPDVSKSGCNSKPQADQHQPWTRAKFPVQIKPQTESDENRQGNRQAETAEKSQIPERLPCFFIQKRYPFALPGMLHPAHLQDYGTYHMQSGKSMQNCLSGTVNLF